MKNSSQQVDRKILKTLEPLNRLNPILLDELAAKSIIDEVSAGKIICRHGEKDSRQIYLLSGQIEVATPGETKTKVIKSKSALIAPIAEGSPRKVTLKAKANSTLLYIDADLLELLMSDEPELNATYEVTEISSEDNDDWMLTFLQSPAFLQLPTENIQKLLTNMEEIPAKKDQVVIQQGGTDDNYYIVKSGSCNVQRQPYKGSANVLLATLPTGSGFGEEALISNGKRNATITMREDGSLMRLKKNDFLTLLINPLIPYFEHNETQQKLDAGCVVIDVRTEEESKNTPLEGSVNIPLSMLRLKFDSLNAEREYLLVCNDGSQSAAAAFLMIQSGLKCSVLRNGMGNSKSKLKSKPAASNAKAKAATSPKVTKQIEEAKKQTEQIATQQEQIKAEREKSERDILKHKKELAESRARIAQKKQPKPSVAQADMVKLKEKATQELAKAQAESKAIELRQQETAKNVQRAEEMIKQSAAAAEQTRKQAEQEAVLIKQRATEEAEQLRAEKQAAELAKLQAQQAAELMKQRAIEEAEKIRAEKVAVELEKIQAQEEAALIKQQALNDAEHLRAEKAAAELAKAQAESKAIERRQKESNEAMLLAEEMMKQTVATAEQARKQAEDEAEKIKQHAIEEAEYLRAEVEVARQKMERDAIRIKAEEKVIKDNALKMRNEADEIRRSAMDEAQQVRSEIEATRALLNQKLQQTQDEENRKHAAILAEAKAQADILAQSKTQQAATDAEAIRQKAKQDALRLHDELEATRHQIEAEAARVISELKERSEKSTTTIAEGNKQESESALQIATKEAEAVVDYTSVSIPGLSHIEPINDSEAKRKAHAIKEKLAQSQKIKASQQAEANTENHKTNNGSVLVGDDDLFIFQEPKTPSYAAPTQLQQSPNISQRTEAESALTQISVAPNQQSKSVVIYPQQDKGPAVTNNPFLNQEEAVVSNKPQVQNFDKEAFVRNNNASKSNALAIAASFLLIIAGAIFTLHVTNTLKVQTIAALFDSGNDTAQAKSAIAKSEKQTKNIRRKVLRADTKVNVKKKVTNKVDDIMQGWKDVLSESQNPKKSNNQ